MGLKDIDRARVPRHVAIIMDGNGRWAKAKGVPRAKGHEAGADSVRAVLDACGKINDDENLLQSLTLFAFSTENWRRPKTEVNTLFRLLSRYIKSELDEIHEKNIRFRFIGRRDGLAEKTLREMDEAAERTKDNTSLLFNIAVNYGGRAEIVDAAAAIARDVRAGRLKLSDLDEAEFEQHLYAPETANLDLLIRTSGESRLSNFMLWQASYAEFIVCNTLWPDFRPSHFYQCICDYQTRQRNFGGR